MQGFSRLGRGLWALSVGGAVGLTVQGFRLGSWVWTLVRVSGAQNAIDGVEACRVSFLICFCACRAVSLVSRVENLQQYSHELQFCHHQSKTQA